MSFISYTLYVAKPNPLCKQNSFTNGSFWSKQEYLDFYKSGKIESIYAIAYGLHFFPESKSHFKYIYVGRLLLFMYTYSFVKASTLQIKKTLSLNLCSVLCCNWNVTYTYSINLYLCFLHLLSSPAVFQALTTLHKERHLHPILWDKLSILGWGKLKRSDL